MAIHLRELKKVYVAPDGGAVPVIDVPEFNVADGEQVGLIGGSGTGKTTLLHLIAGILTADSGSILFDLTARRAPVGSLKSPETMNQAPAGVGSAAGVAPGVSAPPASAMLDYRSPALPNAAQAPESEVDITRLSEADRDVFRGRYIGYIFQTHHLLPGFTALENVLLGMSFTGRKSDPEWARHLLREVGLSDRLGYRPGKLSVGQQQRVAVARALANRPRLVLADEPTGALDPKNAQQVLDLIRKLCGEVNASLILVSHDPTLSSQLPRVVSLAELNRATVM
ncbi:MAG TPA: ABC transporter ATP-binding protein [Tepidisphaeraceae bacterium]|nr:ABC transporter ATP-binding protein [Tepidisphaeraceae bacterium]